MIPYSASRVISRTGNYITRELAHSTVCINFSEIQRN